ncbi:MULTISPECIES: hypothetical protein [unclassified Mesorhizobium]|uniref:hypothetical protein n=1 Tax=unclassified Mesorhizobium TaxID=325217 RepID=UPI000FD4E30E|nr:MULTISPECIES: hypothetical protein [unclassified Mesorhizobium]RVB75794.1 hypothetical protein EN885_18155 [Mesorhizobium sp. M6A.T.Cr.TU.014.01.1.1]RWP78706.1 MAG: hypothetical protein EOR09_05230 [Mesorhizobium sp.]RWP79371.1 MAG: hypothetical protein EOR10_11270 [Mesorhizobium sp.]RWQ03438.1 MAG: hypothetical protein EOR91_19330 [Mesorhizobium sp.]RWQ04247.1 MAG: hypothetical protein EOR90_16480 [Mesorhizobium sp.]
MTRIRQCNGQETGFSASWTKPVRASADIGIALKTGEPWAVFFHLREPCFPRGSHGSSRDKTSMRTLANTRIFEISQALSVWLPTNNVGRFRGKNWTNFDKPLQFNEKYAFIE